jgi:hypothetical protein
MPKIKHRKAYGGKRLFIVEMLRWGDREGHSYIIGAWRKYEDALLAAKQGMADRGGKYDAEIHETMIDSYGTETYRRISWGDFNPNELEDVDVIKEVEDES